MTLAGSGRSMRRDRRVRIGLGERRDADGRPARSRTAARSWRASRSRARSTTSRPAPMRSGRRIGRTASLVRIDPETNEIAATYTLGTSADGFRIADDAIWVAGDRGQRGVPGRSGRRHGGRDDRGGQQAELDRPRRRCRLGREHRATEPSAASTRPRTRSSGTFEVGRGPVYLAVLDGRVWVANGGRAVGLGPRRGDRRAVADGHVRDWRPRSGRRRRLDLGARPPRAEAHRQPQGHDDLAPGSGRLTLRWRRPYAAVPGPNRSQAIP